MADDIDEIPDEGAVFTFGRSRFADNIASKFWIRNDKILFVACGDEHSAIVTERGRLYTFGSNDWGQLGHGHTKLCSKPSSVKALKSEKVVSAACGRTHTLVATDSGKLFTFGSGGDGQLGHNSTQDSHVPKQIESLPEREYKTVSCGVYHSAALTVSGELFTWGSSSEGENGHEEGATLLPKKIEFRRKVVHVSCGYYHTGVVTDDGKIYTFGENENGKLGLTGDQLSNTKIPQPVTSSDRYEYISCGARHTVALTRTGTIHTFGDGSHGQLGHGSSMMQCDQPTDVTALHHVKVVAIAAGECHTAAMSDKGKLYTFGDGRHGKLAQGEECFSNLFTPTHVKQFKKLKVTGLSCGGCHMLVMATKTNDISIDEEDEEDGTLANSFNSTTTSMQFGNNTTILSGTNSLISPRDKRRLKDLNSSNTWDDSIGGGHSKRLAPINITKEILANKNTLPKLEGYTEKTNDNSPKKRPMPTPRSVTDLRKSRNDGLVENRNHLHRQEAAENDSEDDDEDDDDYDDYEEDSEEEEDTEIGHSNRENKLNNSKEKEAKAEDDVINDLNESKSKKNKNIKARSKNHDPNDKPKTKFQKKKDEEEEDDGEEDEEEHEEKNKKKKQTNGKKKDKIRSGEKDYDDDDAIHKKEKKKKKEEEDREEEDEDEGKSNRKKIEPDAIEEVEPIENADDKTDTAGPQKSGFLSFLRRKKTQPPAQTKKTEETKKEDEIPKDTQQPEGVQKSGVCSIL